MKYESSYLLQVAQVAMSQIITGVGENVVASWGLRGYGCGEVVGRDGYVLPCLVLKVSSLIHTGLVVVALNDSADVYEVQLKDENGHDASEWHTDVYCDQLGSLIDSLVERPVGMTDEDYEELSSLDSFIKELADAAGVNL